MSCRNISMNLSITNVLVKWAQIYIKRVGLKDNIVHRPTIYVHISSSVYLIT